MKFTCVCCCAELRFAGQLPPYQWWSVAMGGWVCPGCQGDALQRPATQSLWDDDTDPNLDPEWLERAESLEKSGR